MQALAALAALIAAWPRPAGAARSLPAPGLRVSFARHGSDWTQGSCSSRNEQSPVNLNELYRPVDNTFSYFYANVHSQNITLRNDGRSISINVTGEGFGGVSLPFAVAPWYSLKRIDLHAASEHTLRGKHAPIEVQLVHQASTISDPTAGRQLVTVSILVDCESPPTAERLWPALLQRSEGGVRGRGAGAELQSPEAVGTYTAPAAEDADFNPAFQVFVDQQPPIFDEDATVSLSADKPLQLGNLLAGGTFFMYRGSETLPPCEERVIWLVRRERVKASNAQVRALFDRLYVTSRGFGNYRTIMPLNQRLVRVWSALEHEPPAIPLKPPFARKLPQSSHDDQRESPAVELSKDAITIAKAAADYAKDLDLRLRAGSEAHLQAVKAPLPTPPPPPLDERWAAARVAEEVKREVREAVSESMYQVLPAAANLARSYLRQEILRAGGFHRQGAFAAPSPAPAWAPSAAPPLLGLPAAAPAPAPRQ